MKLFIITILVLVVNGDIKQLDIKENLVCKQLILKGELKCQEVHADRIVTEEIDIPTEFSSDVLELNSLSPFRSDTRASAFIEETREDTIFISANFQEIYRDDDDESTDHKTIQTDFIQIHGQSQWIPIIVDEQNIGWKKESKNLQNDHEKLRQILKQNSYFSYKHEHFKRSQLDKYIYERNDNNRIYGKWNDELIFQYNDLPQNHTYIQVTANFVMLTDFWRFGTRMIMRVDGQTVWMQSHHQNLKICLYLEHLLSSIQSNRNLQTEFNEMLQQEWTIPINLSVKHIRHKLHIEFGLVLGNQNPDFHCLVLMILHYIINELNSRFQLIYIVQMKLIVLFALVLMTIAVNDNQTKQKSIEEQHPSLFRALKNMALLQEQSQQLDYSRLINAINDLESEITQNKEDENASFNKDFLSNNADQEFYENQITQYQVEVAQHEVDLADLTEARNTLQSLLNDAIKEQQDLTLLRNQLDQQIKTDAANTAAQLQEYDDSAAAIDEALNMLTSLKNADSLVQVNDKLKTHLSKQKVFFQPLIVALAEIAQSNFANQELISKVTKLLNQLRTSLLESRLQLVVSSQGLEAMNKELLSTYDQKLNVLSTVILPDFRENIEIKDAEIKAKSNLLNDAKSNLQDAQDNLKATQDAWIVRANLNSKLVQQYENDLSLIQQVKQSFDRAGIKQ
ncbi:unnamed protein product [Paramecium pentaurelia]|uniref:Uncharacterized protein n=1 Tax=Paramecium pentaurelia TaxID=43138 RepID=A0A8S1X333_9CILI|nr:unnamed protein product [Paramecium pentaurelia]